MIILTFISTVSQTDEIDDSLVIIEVNIIPYENQYWFYLKWWSYPEVTYYVQMTTNGIDYVDIFGPIEGEYFRNISDACFVIDDSNKGLFRIREEF